MIQALVLAILCLSGDTESNFRCGTHLVGLGASPLDVQNVCGVPAHVSTITTVLRSAKGGPVRVFEQIIWVYDFGPVQFTRSLIFESGALRVIYVGEYGQ